MQNFYRKLETVKQVRTGLVVLKLTIPKTKNFRDKLLTNDKNQKII